MTWDQTHCEAGWHGGFCLMSVSVNFPASRTCSKIARYLVGTMPSKKSMAKVRVKIRRALRNGTMPIDIARKLGIPLLLIAEVAIWEETIRQSQGTGLDL